jgi:histone H1/5
MASGSNLHQLNLALSRGAEKETFVFPKGPSGKVKLAPKHPKVAADAKEVL